MAFTPSADINVLQASDSLNVGAGAGNDKYILSTGSNLAPNQAINISDTEGVNTLQLIGGLTITSSKVGADVLQLTLSNGATINLFGANTFTFEIGGSPLTGTPGTIRTFDSFVTNVLSVAVPTGATVTNGAANIVVASDGSTTNGGVTTTTPPGTFNLTSGSDTVTYNDNANLTVNGLGGSDTVTINGNGNNTFNNTGGTGNANTITFTGSGSKVVNTGDGADTVSLTGSGSATVAAGAGANIVDLGNVTGFSTVTTGVGSDTITAGSGGSLINAGPGNDTVTGGAGLDTIQFSGGTPWGGVTPVSPTGIDTITKFTGGVDILAFSASTFHNMTFGGAGTIASSHIGLFNSTSQLLNANVAGAQSLAGGMTVLDKGAILLVGTNAPNNILDVYVADEAAIAGNSIANEVAVGYVILVGRLTVTGSALTAADFVGIS